MACSTGSSRTSPPRSDELRNDSTIRWRRTICLYAQSDWQGADETPLTCVCQFHPLHVHDLCAINPADPTSALSEVRLHMIHHSNSVLSCV